MINGLGRGHPHYPATGRPKRASYGRLIQPLEIRVHTTGLSSFSYQKRGKIRFGLPAAMLIHAAFNLGTLALETDFTFPVIFLSTTFILMLTGILLLSKIKGPTADQIWQDIS